MVQLLSNVDATNDDIIKMDIKNDLGLVAQDVVDKLPYCVGCCFGKAKFFRKEQDLGCAVTEDFLEKHLMLIKN